MYQHESDTATHGRPPDCDTVCSAVVGGAPPVPGGSKPRQAAVSVIKHGRPPDHCCPPMLPRNTPIPVGSLVDAELRIFSHRGSPAQLSPFHGLGRKQKNALLKKETQVKAAAATRLDEMQSQTEAVSGCSSGPMGGLAWLRS